MGDVFRMNMDRKQWLDQFMASLERNDYYAGHVILNKPHKGIAVTVAYGPSLIDTWKQVKGKGDIFACNGAFDFLVERGIVPRYHVICDGHECTTSFVQNARDDVVYLIASQCHPSLFEALKGRKVALWHSYAGGKEAEILNHWNKKNWIVISGGNSVGMRSLNLQWAMGYRKHHVYGIDGCYIKGQDHATHQDFGNGDISGLEPVFVGDRKYWAAKWMREQNQLIPDICGMLKTAGSKVIWHGDSLAYHAWKDWRDNGLRARGKREGRLHPELLPESGAA